MKGLTSSFLLLLILLLLARMGEATPVHYAFKSIQSPEIPEVADPSQVVNPIDSFVLRKLETKDLGLSTNANKSVIHRRLTHDLTGLPPTPDEIQSFLSNDEPDAYERLVDRLLASPRYGERWARHWLDVVRFADTDGKLPNLGFSCLRWKNVSQQNVCYWVAGVGGPFDLWISWGCGDADGSSDARYILDRDGDLATQGDQVEIASVDQRKFADGREAKSSPLWSELVYGGRYDLAPESKVLLRGGDTGEFISADGLLLGGVDPEEVATKPGEWKVVATSLDRLPNKFRRQVKSLYKKQRRCKLEIDQLDDLLREKKRLSDEIDRLLEMPKAYAGKFVKPIMTYLLHRGDPMQRKEPVAAGGLSKVGVPMKLSLDAPEQERRRALASWLTDQKNPLTARVMVNRLWHYHFGTGIVDTPSDLGLNGGKPTHPELLDWLASEFVESGWSLKTMHRLIVMSNTYRQSSDVSPRTMSLDSSMRFLWRYPPRRLEAEAIRDSILMVSGNLDLRMGGEGFDLSLSEYGGGGFVRIYKPRVEFGPEHCRRMVYERKPRLELEDTFGSFDCPDALQITPRRSTARGACRVDSTRTGTWTGYAVSDSDQCE